MFFELTNDMDKADRQVDMEVAAYTPIRYCGWAAATEVDYRRDDAEDSTNWQHVDSRWEDEADIDYNNSERGMADARAVLRKTARFGFRDNNAMRIREEAEIKETMAEMSRQADDILMTSPMPVPKGRPWIPSVTDSVQIFSFVQALA